MSAISFCSGTARNSGLSISVVSFPPSACNKAACMPMEPLRNCCSTHCHDAYMQKGNTQLMPLKHVYKQADMVVEPYERRSQVTQPVPDMRWETCLPAS